MESAGLWPRVFPNPVEIMTNGYNSEKGAFQKNQELLY